MSAANGITRFARARAADRIATANAERLLVLADPAEDPVHDLRVSLRRLEQVFELFETEPLGLDQKSAIAQMKDWLAAAGRVRDCDVVAPLIHAPWTNDLLALRKERAAHLVDLLKTGPLAVPQAQSRGPALSQDIVHFARIILPREARLYFTAGARAARKNHSLGRLHEFRLHGKSLRYSLELFEPVYGPRLNRLQKMLKRSQTLLGEMADARAGLKLLRHLNAPDSTLEPLRALANEKREAFTARWLEEVPDEAAAAHWVDYLRRYARLPQ